MILYRGINSKYRNETFVPSGSRSIPLETMKREIDGYLCMNHESFWNSINMSFKTRSNEVVDLYREASTQGFYNYFLSLFFLNLKLKRNEIITDFLSLQENLLDALNGLSKINRSQLAHFCLEEVYIPLKKQNYLHLDRFKKTLAIMSYFQHLNHVFDNRTPTLCMDWTDDICIAEQFGDLIVSIDLDEYQFYSMSTELIGVTSYRDGLNKNNKLMLEQKGYVIFWPWIFTFEELLVNNFGKSIKFKIEN